MPLTWLPVQKTLPISYQSSHCKDIFLCNHPCSTAETVAYDMLEGIKDGHNVGAKFDIRGLFFKTPNTVMVFSNEFPMVEVIKKDRGRIYEIIGEDLYNTRGLSAYIAR